MLDILGAILNASTLTYWVAATMTVAAGSIVHIMTASWTITGVFVPAVWFGGLAGVYAFRAAGITLMPEQETNIVLTACAGMIVAALLVFLCIRCVYALGDLKKPVVKDQPLPQ